MKTIMHCDKNDYDQLPRYVRNAVKAIITKEGKIGLIHFTKENLYDFPGGGIEEGESSTEAIIREIKEEAGATVKPLSIKEFKLGKYALIYKEIPQNRICERYFSYYFCDIEDGYTEPRLTEHEINSGQQFVFVTIDEAISTNEVHIQKGQHWVENPMDILRLLNRDE